MDGWKFCDFTSFSTVFQSYQDNEMSGIIFWNDFTIFFASFLHENAYKNPGVRKKSHFEFFSFHATKSLLRICCPFRDIWTILHDWFLDYFCATIRFLYNCWKPVFEVCIIGKICRKIICQSLVFLRAFLCHFIESA